MNAKNSWYEKDTFWELFAPILFNPQRQASTAEEVDNVMKLLQIQPPAKILDLCCGQGRHSIEFSSRNFHVIGVDRTTAFIERANLEAEKRQLKATFIIGDMREYCEPNGFDLIINMFGSFGYFENSSDDRKVVTNMYTTLRPGGQFLIETAGKEILASNFQENDWSEVGDLLLLSERKVSQNWGRIETRWLAIQGTTRTEYRVSVHAYSAVELSSLFFDCGFRDVQVYGSLEGADYDQRARRLIVVGQK